MRNKKGGLLDEESVKLILAVVVFVAMVFLMLKLFSPVFEKEDEGAKSYFEILKKTIGEADMGRNESFIMLDNGDKNSNFYLVYFGEEKSVGKVFEITGGVWYSSILSKELMFRQKMVGENVICVCFEKDKNIVCRYCKNLDLPAVFSDYGNSGNWAIGEGVRMRVYKDGGKYDFKSW